MKKIFAILIAAFIAVVAVSCGSSANVENDNVGNGGMNTEQPDTPEAPEVETPEVEMPESEPVEKIPEGTGELKVISYNDFKKVIGYSMYPYDNPVNAEKNMVKAVTGFNGNVELTYFSFVANQDAAAYFDEIMENFNVDSSELTEDGEYEVCKFTYDDYYFMMARLNNTMIFGSAGDGYQSIFDWLYGLGYVTK